MTNSLNISGEAIIKDAQKSAATIGVTLAEYASVAASLAKTNPAISKWPGSRKS
jgi:hypothetical protein